jgi:hypothetical protein
MAVLLIAILLFLAAGFAAVLGAGWLAVLPLLLALIVGAWFLVTLASGRTPATAVRETEPPPELLGPGGPDDPNANT